MKRVQDHFLNAIELPAAERETFLLSQVDPEDRAELFALLAAHESDGPLAPLSDDVAPLPWQGRVANYRLIELLGVGGMGVVYLAERDGPGYTQRVALKLLRAGYADPRLEQRLVEERRILARLEHPGIARFIDGGTTESGQSYFAMEYVQGTSLLAYCDERRLSLEQRLHIILAVCDAIQVAHNARVVHGDLKPENILVAGDGQPKLLDFGIAELAEPSPARASGQRTTPWLTPGYASPGQVLGQRLTALDDVYALGVVLYQLLCGERPYETEGLSADDIQRVVCFGDVTPPSRRATTPAGRRALTGDLDAIVLTAMHKDPARRYPSASRLADDLRRYLEKRPVSARDGGALYRAEKFVQRHRAGAAAAVVVFAALVSGTAVATWQAHEARRARDQAEEALRQSESVTSFLIGMFESSDPRQPVGDTLVARAFLQRGLAQVEQIPDQPDLQARLLDAIGNVLIGLDEVPRARQVMERALAIRTRVHGPSHPTVAMSLRDLAATARLQAEYARGESLLVRALSIQREALGSQHPEVAQTLMDLGFLLPYLNRSDAAESTYREAFEIRRATLGVDHPLTVTSMLLVGGAERRLGRDAEAVSTLRAALAASRRAYGNAHPQVATALLYLADALSDDRSGYAEAERAYREAVDIQRRAFGGDAVELVHGISNLGELLVIQGRMREAEALLREALALRERRLGPEHTDVAKSQELVAQALAQQSHFDEAEAMQRDALRKYRRALGDEHPLVAHSLIGLGAMLELRGELGTAERLVREGLALRERIWGPDAPLVALARAQLGTVVSKRGRYAEGERLLQGAIVTLSAAVAPAHKDLRGLHRRLADLYDAWGRPEDARRERQLAELRGT